MLLIWAAKCQQSHTHEAHSRLFSDSNGLQNLALKGLWLKGVIANR